MSYRSTARQCKDWSMIYDDLPLCNIYPRQSCHLLHHIHLFLSLLQLVLHHYRLWSLAVIWSNEVEYNMKPTVRSWSKNIKESINCGPDLNYIPAIREIFHLFRRKFLLFEKENVHLIAVPFASQNMLNPAVRRSLNILEVIIPAQRISLIHNHRLTAPPAAPRVSGRVIQASVWIPRSIHCLRDELVLTAECIWKIYLLYMICVNFEQLPECRKYLWIKTKRMSLNQPTCCLVNYCERWWVFKRLIILTKE